MHTSRGGVCATCKRWRHLRVASKETSWCGHGPCSCRSSTGGPEQGVLRYSELHFLRAHYQARSPSGFQSSCCHCSSEAACVRPGHVCCVQPGLLCPLPAPKGSGMLWNPLRTRVLVTVRTPVRLRPSPAPAVPCSPWQPTKGPCSLTAYQ